MRYIDPSGHDPFDDDWLNALDDWWDNIWNDFASWLGSGGNIFQTYSSSFTQDYNGDYTLTLTDWSKYDTQSNLIGSATTSVFSFDYGTGAVGYLSGNPETNEYPLSSCKETYYPIPINPFTFEGGLSTFAVGFGRQLYTQQKKRAGAGEPAESFFDLPIAVISGLTTLIQARAGKQVFPVPQIMLDSNATTLEKIVGYYFTQEWDENILNVQQKLSN